MSARSYYVVAWTDDDGFEWTERAVDFGDAFEMGAEVRQSLDTQVARESIRTILVRPWSVSMEMSS